MKVIKNERTRKAVALLCAFVLIPAVTLTASFIRREKSYTLAAIMIAALSVVLFISGFDKKKTGSRRMVVTSVLTAAAVAGRFLFTPLPGVNPITAFSVLSGIYLGKESGFFTGAVAAVVSNSFAGQGVWTPFQMMSWGFTGLFAGYCSAPLKKSKVALAFYALISAVGYSLLMDLWTVLWTNGVPELNRYLAAVASSAPFTAVYAASNLLFLLLLNKPIGKRLERIKLKYGI